MRRRWVLLIIAANLVGFTVLAFLYPHFMVAPGPLVPAHASLEKNCFACHSPFRGAVAERCTSCHTVSDIGLRKTTGAPFTRASAITPFHQSLTSQNCMACHTDHTNPALTPRSRPAFSHGLLNTAIRENCASCHAAPATLFIAARQPNAPSVIARIAGSQPHSITQNSSCWTEIIRRLHHLPYDRRSSAIHLLRLP